MVRKNGVFWVLIYRQAYFGQIRERECVLLEKKNLLDILKEICMIECRPIYSPMDLNQKLMTKQDESLNDLEQYRRLVEKTIYLTITRPNICFAVGVVSQFM